MSVKFQSDQTILNTNIAASRLYEILPKDVFSDIETGPWIRASFETRPAWFSDSSAAMLTMALYSVWQAVGRFSSQRDVTRLQDLANSWRRKISSLNYCIALKFDKHLGSTTAEKFVKCHSDERFSISSRLHEIRGETSQRVLKHDPVLKTSVELRWLLVPFYIKCYWLFQTIRVLFRYICPQTQNNSLQ